MSESSFKWWWASVWAAGFTSVCALGATMIAFATGETERLPAGVAWVAFGAWLYWVSSMTIALALVMWEHRGGHRGR